MTSSRHVAVPIAAPAATVWRVLVDVERWPQWTASMSEVDKVEPDPGALMDRRAREARRTPVVSALVAICAASMLVLGAWAFAAPRSFADFIDYAPYNRHLVHDAGAFQLGIGAALAGALAGWDGLLVALTGFAVASGLHTLSHYGDRHAGGHASDVPNLGLLTLLGLCAIYLHIRRRKS